MPAAAHHLNEAYIIQYNASRHTTTGSRGLVIGVRRDRRGSTDGGLQHKSPNLVKTHVQICVQTSTQALIA